MSPERWAFRPETYAVAARRDAWSNALARLAMKWEATIGDDVAGTLTVRRFAGSFTAARLAAPPQIILTTPAQKPAMRWLAMPLEGDMHLAQNDRRSKLAPDDVVFGDPSAFTPLVIHTHSQLLFLGLPDAALRTRMLDSVSPRHARLPPNAVGTRVLAGLLRTVAETMDDMQEEMARPLETTLLDMLAQMLTAANDATPDGAAGGALRQGTARTLQADPRRHRAAPRRSHIDDRRRGGGGRHLGALRAETVRAQRRKFFALLRMRRLERAREDLTDPAHSHLSISDICFRWGFNDAAHFSRAFHDAFGVSPRNFRRAATAEMADRILQYANRGWPEAPRSDCGARKPSWKTRPPRPTGELHPDNSPATADQDRRCARSPPDRATIILRRPRRPFTGAISAATSRRSWKSTAAISSPSKRCPNTPTTITTGWCAGIPGPKACSTGRRERKSGRPPRRRPDGRHGVRARCRRRLRRAYLHGPIAVRGARPNDLIELRIVDIKPRLSANPAYRGKAFGSNAATWWGFQYSELLPARGRAR